ncbi:hypothetical protein R5R35_001541 [Gryllus longicercus]|uniref:Peroxisomal membrane protein PEX16 n=1 Tax=Gryllus longicercus TaxID=2509291 RepID=A0AAN9WV24_9ORTH
MPGVLFTLPELYQSYKVWVSDNPQLASDVESTVKWISYFIAGRVNNSNVLSELVFSLSNLLVLFNDRIIHHAKNIKTSTGDTLKVWLTVLEYSEVFIEVSARKLWGEKGKWIVIIALQIAKCISRLILLVLHKENIIQNPPVPPLKRNKLAEKEKTSVDPGYSLNSVTFTLKRSGRLIRRISAAPPAQCRSWKPPIHNVDNHENQEDEDENRVPAVRKHLYAEVLYVIKPLMHLGAMGRWGIQAWKPWLVALGVDLLSLHLYKYRLSSTRLSNQKKLELSRRSVALLLYILRSPFYEKYSKDRIQAFLEASSQTIPLVRLVCNPLAQYIPVWQDTYFYTWST